MRQRVIWDFFCGLGGGSAAFRDAGWHVVTVDNDPMFRPTLLADVAGLEPADYEPPDFGWFSPPCDEFALRRFDPRLQPSLALVEASARIIRDWSARNPRFYWALENVRHSVPFISRVLGPHKIGVGPYFLWGNFPLFIPQPVSNKGSPRGPHWLRAANRAKIPYSLSSDMERAVSYVLNATDPEQEPARRRALGPALDRRAWSPQEPPSWPPIEPEPEPARAPLIEPAAAAPRGAAQELRP